jgi:hypothetical protein
MFQLCVSYAGIYLKGHPYLAVGWFGPSHFEPEDGGHRFLRNVS